MEESRRHFLPHRHRFPDAGLEGADWMAMAVWTGAQVAPKKESDAFSLNSKILKREAAATRPVPAPLCAFSAGW